MGKFEQVKLIKERLKVLPGTRIVPFSAQTKQGREEIWELISEAATAEKG